MLKSLDIEARTLLIVESEELCQKVLLRLFSKRFDEIFTVSGFEQAIQVCKDNQVTHLISAFVFKRDSHNGYEIVSYLKNKYPSIKRGIIFTGSSDISDLTVPPEVDSVLFKPGDARELIKALG